MRWSVFGNGDPDPHTCASVCECVRGVDCGLWIVECGVRVGECVGVRAGATPGRCTWHTCELQQCRHCSRSSGGCGRRGALTPLGITGPGSRLAARPTRLTAVRHTSPPVRRRDVVTWMGARTRAGTHRRAAGFGGARGGAGRGRGDAAVASSAASEADGQPYHRLPPAAPTETRSSSSASLPHHFASRLSERIFNCVEYCNVFVFFFM